MVKFLKKRIVVLLGLGAIVLATVVISNLYLRNKYEATVDSIQKDFLNNESFYNGLITLVEKIDIDQDYCVYYDDKVNCTIVQASNAIVNVDSQLLMGLNEKLETMKCFDFCIDIPAGNEWVRLSKVMKDGVNSYRQIDLIYYETPPSNEKGTQLSDHWFLQQGYME